MSSGVLFLLCTAVIILDVVSRKLGFQFPSMGSTRLQELEWQIHTALFSFWLGLGYVHHAHVRIDVAVANATSRVRALIELAGCLLFALPFCAIAIYFSVDFTWTAYLYNEGSPSANGLPWLWIPKGFITVGLVLLLFAVLSMMLRLVVHLFGPDNLRMLSMPGK